jgi:hypothetical protein
MPTPTSFSFTFPAYLTCPFWGSRSLVVRERAAQDSDARQYRPERSWALFETIHAVNHDCVTLTGVRKKGLQLRPFSIFAGGFVREDSVDVEVLELSIRVLIITVP